VNVATEKQKIQSKTGRFIARLLSYFASDTRSYDGSGNNILHQSWGKVGEALQRLAPAAYADSTSTPAGANRPSARLISNTLSDQTEDVRNSRNMSDWVYAWGQFVDHDIDLTTQGTDAFDISGTQRRPVLRPGKHWHAGDPALSIQLRPGKNDLGK
jgi:hypothetical protein